MIMAHLCKLCEFACGLRPDTPFSTKQPVAIFHLSVKTVSRSTGRSATAAAAYRAADKITDTRTAEIHDYTRKSGVKSAEIILPKDAPIWATKRADLWNTAEQSETRKNSTVAREFEIALPSELSSQERKQLAHDFARELVERHGCAADVAIHAPGKEGDNRNHHAHILLTTRRLGPEGFTEKTRELDDRTSGVELVNHWRQRFAELQNERLAAAGATERVDHRSLKAQGIEREPTQHLGPAASGYERRTGQPSDIRSRDEGRAAESAASGKEAQRLTAENTKIDQAIENLEPGIEAMKAARSEFQAEQALWQAEDLKTRLAPVKAVLDPISREARDSAHRTIRQWREAVADEKERHTREVIRARVAPLEKQAADSQQKYQAHMANKPRLFGAEKWMKQGLEMRTELRQIERQIQHASGDSNIYGDEAKAILKVAEQRAKQNNPTLAAALPNAELIAEKAYEQATTSAKADSPASRGRRDENRELGD